MTLQLSLVRSHTVTGDAVRGLMKARNKCDFLRATTQANLVKSNAVAVRVLKLGRNDGKESRKIKTKIKIKKDLMI